VVIFLIHISRIHRRSGADIGEEGLKSVEQVFDWISDSVFIYSCAICLLQYFLHTGQDTAFGHNPGKYYD